jgi:hypothetical protein
MKQLFTLVLIVAAATVVSCGGGTTGTNKMVTVSWSANREAGVNASGGGYTVYYSQQSGFDVSTAYSMDVPYVSGSAAPTSATLQIESGKTYYIKVVAYAQTDGTVYKSTPSAEQKLVLK